MTTTFYAPPSSLRGGQVMLPAEEARHAVRVLRKRAGDEIVVVDGAGGWHRVRLDRVGQEQAIGTVLETRRGVGEPSYDLTMGVGLIKSRNRFETFAEKAVELGVGAIVPLRTARTEKQGLKMERTRRILTAAMKQCGRSRLPSLAEPMALADVVKEAGAYDAALIAHERAPDAPFIGEALASTPDAPRVFVLVGPEGGFSEEEVQHAVAAGCTPVSLGPRRLRAETAGVVAAAAVHFALGSAGSPHSL